MTERDTGSGPSRIPSSSPLLVAFSTSRSYGRQCKKIPLPFSIATRACMPFSSSESWLYKIVEVGHWIPCLPPTKADWCFLLKLDHHITYISVRSFLLKPETARADNLHPSHAMDTFILFGGSLSLFILQRRCFIQSCQGQCQAFHTGLDLFPSSILGPSLIGASLYRHHPMPCIARHMNRKRGPIERL